MADPLQALIDLVGASLEDAETLRVLADFKLPRAKKVDTYACAATGLSFHAGPAPVDPTKPTPSKKRLLVENIQFHAEGDETYLRSEKVTVTFAAYAGLLPGGVVWGDDIPSLNARLGPPTNQKKIGADKHDVLNWLGLREHSPSPSSLYDHAMVSIALGRLGTQSVALWHTPPVPRS